MWSQETGTSETWTDSITGQEMEDPWRFGAAGIDRLVQNAMNKLCVCVNVCMHMHISCKHDIIILFFTQEIKQANTSKA